MAVRSDQIRDLTGKEKAAMLLITLESRKIRPNLQTFERRRNRTTHFRDCKYKDSFPLKGKMS